MDWAVYLYLRLIYEKSQSARIAIPSGTDEVLGSGLGWFSHQSSGMLIR